MYEEVVETVGRSLTVPFPLFRQQVGPRLEDFKTSRVHAAMVIRHGTTPGSRLMGEVKDSRKSQNKTKKHELLSVVIIIAKDNEHSESQAGTYSKGNYKFHRNARGYLEIDADYVYPCPGKKYWNGHRITRTYRNTGTTRGSHNVVTFFTLYIYPKPIFS